MKEDVFSLAEHKDWKQGGGERYSTNISILTFRRLLINSPKRETKRTEF